MQIFQKLSAKIFYLKSSSITHQILAHAQNSEFNA